MTQNNNEIKEKIREILTSPATADGVRSWKEIEEQHFEFKINSLADLFTEMVEGELEGFVEYQLGEMERSGVVAPKQLEVIKDGYEKSVKQYILDRVKR